MHKNFTPSVILNFPSPTIYRHSLSVRIDDINYGRHLGHDTLVSLLHDARCGWLAQQGLTELSIDGQSLGWVVADLIVNYRAEAFYADALTIELAIGKISAKGAEIFIKSYAMMALKLLWQKWVWCFLTMQHIKPPLYQRTLFYWLKRIKHGT